MENVLISVNSDLPSRMAIRFTCQLRRYLNMSLFPIHIAEMENKKKSVGKGWVQKTWEDSVFHGVKNRINRILKDEKTTCSSLAPLRIYAGKREEHIKKEIKLSNYDLFVEGMFHSFQTEGFIEKLRSDLFRERLCPVLLVKNWTGEDNRILLIGENNIPESVMEAFMDLFKESDIEPEALICRFSDVAPAEDQDSEGLIKVDSMDRFFADHGKKYKGVRIIGGNVDYLSSCVRNYSLIISAIPEKGNPMEELLAKSPCSVLFST